MKTVRNAMLLLWGVLICYPIGMKAQDKFDASVGMDLVSGYIWRGQDLGNVSIQPEVSLAYKGFSLTGWGTVGFDCRGIQATVLVYAKPKHGADKGTNFR